MDNKLYRYTTWMILLIAIVAALFLARAFLIPIVFSLVIATLLKPVLYQLLNWGAPEWLAITGSVLSFVLAVGVIVAVMVLQVKSVAEKGPAIQQQVATMRGDIQTYVTDQLGVSKEAQDRRIDAVMQQVQGSMSWLFGSTLTFLSNAFLSIIYIVLFLSQRRRFLEFGRRIAPDGDRQKMADTIRQAADVSSDYLVGKLKVILILAVVYAIGFTIGGVPFGILLAIEAAVFTLIPYVGNLIGGGIAVVFAAISGGGSAAALVVIAVMTVAQLLENYILQPLIVGDEIDLNPWATVIVVVAFGLLWGVMGAVLSLPIAGMIRVVAERYEGLHPLAFLLGQDAVEE